MWPSDALPVIALRPTGLKRPGVRLGEAIPENVTFWDDSLGRKKGAKGRGRGAGAVRLEGRHVVAGTARHLLRLDLGHGQLRAPRRGKTSPRA